MYKDMYFLSDYEACFGKNIRVDRIAHSRIVNGKVFAVKGSSFFRQGGISKLFEKVNGKRRVFGTVENRKGIDNIFYRGLRYEPYFEKKPLLKQKGLTSLEAQSLLDYLGDGYSDINGYNFDSGLNKENGLMLLYVNKGLKKLKRATPDNLPDWLTQNEKKKDLVRYININDDGVDNWLNGLKSNYDNNHISVKNGVLTNKSPLSTAVDAPRFFDNHFIKFNPKKQTQIQFQIKRKTNTEGRWIGDFKNAELEVLYPSNTKFKIKKIEKYESMTEKLKTFLPEIQKPNYPVASKPGYKIYLEEV